MILKKYLTPFEVFGEPRENLTLGNKYEVIGVACGVIAFRDDIGNLCGFSDFMNPHYGFLWRYAE